MLTFYRKLLGVYLFIIILLYNDFHFTLEGLSSNFWWLRNVNLVTFVEQYMMCKKKRVLAKKNVYKRAKNEFDTMNLSQKESPWNGNIPGAGINKVILTIFRNMKGTFIIYFFEKGATGNSASNCQLIFFYQKKICFIFQCNIHSLRHFPHWKTSLYSKTQDLSDIPPC